MPFSIEEFQEELDEMNERDRMLLTWPDDLLPLWIEGYSHPKIYAENIPQLMETTIEALRICWGPDAFIRVSLETGVLYYCHADGREIERVIAF